jgi:hypothetical protein
MSSATSILKDLDARIEPVKSSYTLPEVMDMFRRKQLTPAQCVELCDKHNIWPSAEVLWINFVQGVDQSETTRKYWAQMALKQ